MLSSGVLCRLIHGENERYREKTQIPASRLSAERCFRFACSSSSTWDPFPACPLRFLTYPFSLHVFNRDSCQSTCSSLSHSNNPPVGPHFKPCLTSSCPVSFPWRNVLSLLSPFQSVFCPCHSPRRSFSKVTNHLPSPVDMSICFLIPQLLGFLLSCSFVS